MTARPACGLLAAAAPVSDVPRSGDGYRAIR